MRKMIQIRYVPDAGSRIDGGQSDRFHRRAHPPVGGHGAAEAGGRAASDRR